MLVEKEIIAPGTYFYTDQQTGLPRKLDVTPELTHYWHEQGSKMLDAGLTVPVPFEHDFNAHPMTPKDKLLNNSGWVKEYQVKDAPDGRKDVLFGVLDIQDDKIAAKLPRTIRWTSPWINSFTDGQGNQWNNVISHLALTTRPRITKQAPFPSIAAALSMASEIKTDPAIIAGVWTPRFMIKDGICLSRAGKLVTRKRDKVLRPQYPIAFSIFTGGIKFAEDDMKELKEDGEEEVAEGKSEEEDADIEGLMNPLQDSTGDVEMEELLCDLLNALGVQMPDNVGESEFKRALYEATMAKIKELSAKGMASGDANAQAAQPNTNSPAGGQNPLIQQEQQPMYMSNLSLEDLQKLPEPMRSVALSMYADNVKLRTEVEASKKVTDSLRDAKLKEAQVLRQQRVALLSKLSPRVKADLEGMLAMPNMALSMGDGGTVNDPLAQTLAVLEKGLSDIPRLLTTEASMLSVQPQPTDGEMSDERANEISDSMARMMGAAPEKKVS